MIPKKIALIADQNWKWQKIAYKCTIAVALCWLHNSFIFREFFFDWIVNVLPNDVKRYAIAFFLFLRHSEYSFWSLSCSFISRYAVVFLRVAWHRQFYDIANWKSVGSPWHFNRIETYYWLNWSKGWILSNSNRKRHWDSLESFAYCKNNRNGLIAVRRATIGNGNMISKVNDGEKWIGEWACL